MKIIEARDGFINFEADESVYLSMFIQADGTDKSYIAQVNQMKKFGNVMIAGAKILFLYNGSELMNYDRTLPSKDAELRAFDVDILKDSVIADKPVIAGKTIDNSRNVFMDLSAFNKKTLFSIDDAELNNLLVRNITKQFVHLGQNVVIIDTHGVISGKKYTAGKDFKLPVDTLTLKFMYESCLNDATAESKATIAEVFGELSEYSKTVPFVPFGALKSIVDDMVDKQHIFKLFVLKNRLANFQKLGYFATDKSEVDVLDKILDSDVSVIDLSKLNVLFQNRYLEFIYSKINPEKTQAVLEMSNTISKMNLKNVMQVSDVHTAFITHSKFVYLNDIKDMFDNFIIEPGTVNNELFKVYSTFLSSMKKGMYLTVGKDINYIPMVSSAQDIDDYMIVETKELSKEEYPDSDVEAVSQEEIASEDEVEETVSGEELEEIVSDDEVDETVSGEDKQDNLLNEDGTEEDYISDEQIEESKIEVLSQDEIMAEIDQQSNSVIEAVSENLEEPSDLELFGEDSDSNEEKNDSAKQNKEDEELAESQILYQNDIENQSEIASDIIEPEFIESEKSEEKITGIDESEVLPEDSSEFAPADENALTDIQAEEIQHIEPEEVLLEDNTSDALDDDILIADEEQVNSDGELSEELQNDFDSDSDIDEPDDGDDDLDALVIDDEMLSIQENDDKLESDDNELSQELSEDGIRLETAQSITDSGSESMSDDFQENDGEDFEELEAEDVSEDDIVIDISDEDEANIIDDELDRQIIEDVDKVYTTLKDDDLEEISDSDLDFIDELNDGEEEDGLEDFDGELEEASDSIIDDGILEQPEEGIVPQRQSNHKKSDEPEILEKRDSSTPIVPVYDADIPQEDMVVSDDIQQGDSVVHAKYGNGIVEKMIKYGTKNLFSINFENIGRRLLDPTLTEIKKI